ncbi:MAG: NAD(P)/FAD-dependent oxidoreductase [Candidatus Micrarchaeota archaeon]|nr:NAD(P)/FAD-dependent oxidoreductase [Candidatus Micrarchaeota archaeon]
MNDNYDVMVVGAGPAGSSAAKHAAEGGASVLLVDRKKEFGVPVRCGEGVGSHWLKELGISISDRSVCARIKGAKLVSPDLKSSVTISTPETMGYVLDRKVFDRELAIDAARAGAETALKTEVVGVTKNNGKVTGAILEYDGKKTEVKSKILIAADGGESLVARMAGINTLATLYDSDFGVEYEMANVECEGLIEIYFGKSWAPRGYAWVFPKGEDVANVGVGIGGMEKPNAIHYLNKFLELDRFKKAQPVALKAGIIPVGAPCRQLVADGLMVVGTSAHQVDPIHGGGICLAIDAGNIAGKVAAKCVGEGKSDAKALSEYEKTWRSAREKKLLRRLLLRKVLEELNDDDYNAAIGCLNDADVGKLLDGNYAPVAGKVLTARPQLLRALKALLTSSETGRTL